MELPRRFLPPMHMLRAFETAARLGSFTAAATELNVTQSAVSRQIRLLEDLLGANLFMRVRQSVALTEAGEIYASEIREALRRIGSATLGFKANPQGGTLKLAILPTFGTRWLAPRLPHFMAANPGINLNLVTRLLPFDFDLEPLDAAIHYGQPDWPGAEMDFLLPETVVPACSRALRARHELLRPEDLLRAPLLHLVSRPDAWERWFSTHGVADAVVHGMLLDQFALMTQAAVAGLGVALLPSFLAEDEFRRGDLVAAIDAPCHTQADGYYLACPVDRTWYPPLQALRAWLQQECKPGFEGSR
ncbi:LysR family transcriptional regulator [Achromobacter xylosoxidans]|uniref:LysR family transcriptional regulator n=1 Tax=Alcaligenes xylosoxydans xylosoxydans TaxID=85698 RepID=A0A1R1JS84_ALCXX|nr:LysR family transcriptional regulator [Achromobacter xylosoxidans]OMG84292.1 LysR family transcriptional regulator [Achromobacter xylosoxidans]BEG74293.1 Glycine cleavage system transcriptional activator [Achromobacter xylosoxidans]